MQGVRLRASCLPCCSTVLHCLLSVNVGTLAQSDKALSALLQTPWPCIVTFDAQLGDCGFSRCCRHAAGGASQAQPHSTAGHDVVGPAGCSRCTRSVHQLAEHVSERRKKIPSCKHYIGLWASAQGLAENVTRASQRGRCQDALTVVLYSHSLRLH